MKRTLFALTIALMLAVAGAHAAATPALLSPAELATRLAGPGADPDLRIVDIRGGREANGKSPFDNGHIVGAQPAPYPQWRGPKDNPGKLPPTGQLTQLVQQLGIERDTPVVVVIEGRDATDFGAAARVAWTLRAGGVRSVSILNGGMQAWRAAGLPVTTEHVDALPTTFELNFDPAFVATRQDIEALVAAGAQSSGAWRLLDARPHEYFIGQDKHAAARVPGTIAGAKNVDNTVWFKGDGAEMVDAAQARRIAQEHGIDTSRPTVSFCNSGHWAATNWFVLSEVLGQEQVKLYPESMIEWSRTGLAMDNVPGRLQQFWMQLKAALASD